MNESLPVIVVTTIYGYQQVAIFQVSYLFFASLSGFLGSLSSIYMPLLFKYEEIRFWKAILQNLALGILFALVYCIFVLFAFIPLFGAAYSESWSIALSFSLLIPLIPMRIFILSYYASRNKNGFISAANAFSGILAFTLFWALKGHPMSSVVVWVFGVMYFIQVALPLAYFALYLSPRGWYSSR